MSKDVVSKTWTLTVSSDGNRYSDSTRAPVSSSWQLIGYHYVPAKMAATIIHPRPDAETNSWERHRLAPEGIAWRIPIAVQGGSWPFRYSVDATSAAKGISIGETYGSTDYGVLTWASPTLGTHTITVTVLTQEYGRNESGFAEPDPITFTLEVAAISDTRFNWFNAGDTITVTAGEQHFYRAGTHVGPTTINGAVHVGYPGESVIWDQTGGGMSGSASGFYLSGIRLNGWDATASHWRSLSFSNRSERLTLFENYWYNHGKGALDSDPATWSNHSCCFFVAMAKDGLNDHKYISFVGNTYDTLSDGGNGTSAFDTYTAQYLVCENNVVKNCQSRYVFWVKSTTGFYTVRNNLAWDNNETMTSPSSIIEVNSFPYFAEAYRYGEVCYNRVRNISVNNSLSRAWGISADLTRSASYPCTPTYYVYRNTVMRTLGEDSDEAMSADSTCSGNLYAKNAGQTVSAFVGFSELDTSSNAALAESDFDSNGLLTGAARTAYLGTKGAEIA